MLSGKGLYQKSFDLLLVEASYCTLSPRQIGQQLRQGKSSLLSLSPLLGFLPVLKAASSSPTTRPCHLCPCTHPAARRRDCCQWKYQVPVQMQSSLPPVPP